MHTGKILTLAFGAGPAAVMAAGLTLVFDGQLTGAAGEQPRRAEGVTFAEGVRGQAAVITRPAALTYPSHGLSPDAFTIAFQVRHEEDMPALFYRRLTYVYHETADLRNRLAIVKREGTNCLVFAMSNGSGRAKGDDFAGDWFSLTAGPLDWPAGTWHQIVATADRRTGLAQLRVDGRTVAQAKGTQMPERFADDLWIGSEMGHSWMRGRLDELTVEPVSRLSAEAVQPDPDPLYPPIPPAAPLFGQTVGRLTGHGLFMNLDFFDVCIGLDAWDMRDCDREMERLVALTAHYGFDRLYYRVSVCGAEAYRTKVMTPADRRAFAGYEGKRGLDGPCANLPSAHTRMADVLERIDPLEVCARYGRKHGLPIYAWVTMWDSLYYATADEFFQKHPEYTWVSRDGKRHIPGVPCYAYPEVRAYRLAQVKELLAYDVDGIMMSPRSHSPWPGRDSPSAEIGSRDYGYNEPVVAEFRRRYGRDPRQAARDSLDELRFVQLKGDFFTAFLREAKAECDRVGKKLVMLSTDTWSDPVRTDRMYVDAETILREKLVHEMCILGDAGADLSRWRVLGGTEVAVTTWATAHGKSYGECLPRIQSQLRAMLANPLSGGSTFHELANFLYPDCWEESIVDLVQPARDGAAARQ